MFLLVAAKSLFPLVLELRLEGLEGGNESPEDEVLLDEVVQHVAGGHLRRRGHGQEHGQEGLHCSSFTLLAKCQFCLFIWNREYFRLTTSLKKSQIGFDATTTLVHDDASMYMK